MVQPGRQNGDHNAAMIAFRQEVHWAPNNVRAWYDLGVTLEKLGRLDEAHVAFTKADVLGSLKPLPPLAEPVETPEEAKK